MAVKLLHRQAADHQDDDLPTVRTQRDDPILTALQRVRSSFWSVKASFECSPDTRVLNGHGVSGVCRQL